MLEEPPADRELPDVVAILLRWQDSGAIWRVIGWASGTVTVGLYQCTGGEEMDRLTSNDPALVRFIGHRRGSED